MRQYKTTGASLSKKTCTHVITGFDNLGIQNQSVDVVILAHTLEFEMNPQQILREVDRILVPEGKAVFLGFNPFSLWGLWHIPMTYENA
ncbi:MAG: class I SAM-dependent methyltransferase [Thiohalomonas sp.]|nr:class I SAM-dependent methyltransferase [Thiohalomonas sp.]